MNTLSQKVTTITAAVAVFFVGAFTLVYGAIQGGKSTQGGTHSPSLAKGAKQCVDVQTKDTKKADEVLFIGCGGFF